MRGYDSRGSDQVGKKARNNAVSYRIGYDSWMHDWPWTCFRLSSRDLNSSNSHLEARSDDLEHALRPTPEVDLLDPDRSRTSFSLTNTDLLRDLDLYNSVSTFDNSSRRSCDIRFLTCELFSLKDHHEVSQHLMHSEAWFLHLGSRPLRLGYEAPRRQTHSAAGPALDAI